MNIKSDSIDSFIDDETDQIYIWQHSIEDRYIGVLFDKNQIIKASPEDIDKLTVRIEQVILEEKFDTETSKLKTNELLQNKEIAGLILYYPNSLHYFKNSDSSYFYVNITGEWQLINDSTEFFSNRLPDACLLCINEIPQIDTVLRTEIDVIHIRDRLFDTKNSFPCIICTLGEIEKKDMHKIEFKSDQKGKTITDSNKLDIIIDAPLERNGVTGDFKGFRWYSDDFWLIFLGDTISRVKDPKKTEKIINESIDEVLSTYHNTNNLTENDIRNIIISSFGHIHYKLLQEHSTNNTQETTFSMAVYHRGYVYFDFVGNSPVIFWDKGKNQLDIYAETKVGKTLLTKESLFDNIENRTRLDSPMRVGNPDSKIEINVFPPRFVKAGDLLILCSDGFLDLLNPYQLDKQCFKDLKILKDKIHNAIFSTRNLSKDNVLDDDVLIVGKYITKSLKTIEEEIKERIEVIEKVNKKSIEDTQNQIKIKIDDLKKNLNEQLQKLQALSNSLLKSVQDQESKFTTINYKVNDFPGQISKIEEEVKNFKNEYSRFQENFSTAKEQIDSINSKIVEFKNNLYNYTSEIEKIAEINQRIGKLENQLQEIAEINQKNVDKLSVLIKQNEEVNKKLKTLEKDSISNTKFNKHVSDLNEKEKEVKVKIKDLEKNMVIESEYKKKIKELEDKNKELSENLEQYKKNNKAEWKKELNNYSTKNKIKKEYYSKEEVDDKIRKLSELEKVINNHKMILAEINETIKSDKIRRKLEKHSKDHFIKKIIVQLVGRIKSLSSKRKFIYSVVSAIILVLCLIIIFNPLKKDVMLTKEEILAEIENLNYKQSNKVDVIHKIRYSNQIVIEKLNEEQKLRLLKDIYDFIIELNKRGLYISDFSLENVYQNENAQFPFIVVPDSGFSEKSFLSKNNTIASLAFVLWNDSLINKTDTTIFSIYDKVKQDTSKIMLIKANEIREFISFVFSQKDSNIAKQDSIISNKFNKLVAAENLQ